MGAAATAGPIGLASVEALLAGGMQFAPRTRMGAVMAAVTATIVDEVEQCLSRDGFVEIVTREGHQFRYTFDYATSAWQRVI